MRAKQYKFTLADIAMATGFSRAKVYRDARDGRLDPTKLDSIAAYVTGVSRGLRFHRAANPLKGKR